MTFAELLQATGWADVKAVLLWFYPDDRESIRDYRRLFSGLRRMSPSESAMRICIRKSQFDGEDAVDEVFGRNGSLNRNQNDFDRLGQGPDSAYALQETEFALGLESRPSWLGMRIDEGTLHEYPMPQIVAHCLWEMAFHGFSEADVIAFRKELDRRVAELDAMTEEERNRYLIPHEQVMERLRSRLDRTP